MHRSSLGSGPVTGLVLLAGFLVFVAAVLNVLVYGMWPHKMPHAFFNLWAYGGLVALFLTWLVLVVYGRSSAPTGAGFGIAATALAMRGACELLLCLAWRWPRPEALSGISEPTMVEVARRTGVFAYFVGLAFVVAACLAEWRLARVGGQAITTPRRLPRDVRRVRRDRAVPSPRN